jgi:hypothetical protein
MATQNIEDMVTLEEPLVSSLAMADTLAKLLIVELIAEAESHQKVSPSAGK